MMTVSVSQHCGDDVGVNIDLGVANAYEDAVVLG